MEWTTQSRFNPSTDKLEPACSEAVIAAPGTLRVERVGVMSFHQWEVTCPALMLQPQRFQAGNVETAQARAVTVVREQIKRLQQLCTWWEEGLLSAENSSEKENK